MQTCTILSNWPRSSSALIYSGFNQKLDFLLDHQFLPPLNLTLTLDTPFLFWLYRCGLLLPPVTPFLPFFPTLRLIWFVWRHPDKRIGSPSRRGRCWWTPPSDMRSLNTSTPPSSPGGSRSHGISWLQPGNRFMSSSRLTGLGSARCGHVGANMAP